MATTDSPTFTDTINQSFFIEALGGAQEPVSYLDRFPDAVYTKGVDSVLVKFLYALLGPTGVGGLREAYLEARLQIEEAGLSTANLDALYTSPFAFARLAQETYDIDASASLLSADDAAQILASDASFRNRAIDFLKSIRAGGTLEGLTLAARSGANHPVELVENYRALYDQYSDRPLGLPVLGTTNSLNEVIVLPRHDVPQNAQQTFVLNGEPASGWFTITVPLGPPYQEILVEAGVGADEIVVPDATQVPPGVYVSITNNTLGSIGDATPTVYAEAGVTQDVLDVSLVYPPYNNQAGQPLNHGLTPATEYWAYVGHAETVPLPYNASAPAVQAAVQSLPVVGSNNVQVTGGPLPDQPIVLTFINDLGGQEIPAIQVSTVPNDPIISGMGTTDAPRLEDAIGSFLNIASTVTTDIVGEGGDGQTNAITPTDEHALEVAIDQLRPLTSLVTTRRATGVTQRLRPSSIFGASNSVEVLRYETGNKAVHWPRRNQVNWIEPGIEHEAPTPVGTTKYHYQGFHTLNNVTAYTEAALADGDYSTTLNQMQFKHWDTKVGPFSHTQRLLYPFLKQFTNPHQEFLATGARADSPEPLVITGRVGNTSIVNEIYPSDYFGLPGVALFQPPTYMWASIERAYHGTPSADYLDIDLGSTQPVNYIYFEATNKPFTISVEYDTYDQAPNRSFVPVTLMPPTIAKSTTSLSYHYSHTNPWTVVETHCTNTLNQMIFTRFLRIGFHRSPNNSPFAPHAGTPIPYSIEVRNLRVGRNLSSPLNRVVP